ncbi:MAG: hypothetical protein Hens3KO_07110 [Henriciella sp.]
MGRLLRDVLVACGAALVIQAFRAAWGVIDLYRQALALTAPERARELVIEALRTVAITNLLNSIILAVVGLAVWKLVWLLLKSTSVEFSLFSSLGVGVISTAPTTGIFGLFGGLIWGFAFWVFRETQLDKSQVFIDEADA